MLKSEEVDMELASESCHVPPWNPFSSNQGASGKSCTGPLLSYVILRMPRHARCYLLVLLYSHVTRINGSDRQKRMVYTYSHQQCQLRDLYGVQQEVQKVTADQAII